MAIDKKEILSLIDRYALGGITNSAIWVLGNDNITIPFKSAEQGILGNVTFNKNPFEKEFEFGVMNSTQLRGMVSVLDDQFKFELNEPLHQVKLSDSNFKGTFVLSPIDLMGEKPKLKKEAEYIYTFELTDTITSNIKNAIKAIGEDNLTFIHDDGRDKIVVGYDRNNSNRMEINLDSENDISYSPVTFRSTGILSIIEKNADSQIDIEVSEAMLKISCTSTDFTSVYWIKKYDQ